MGNLANNLRVAQDAIIYTGNRLIIGRGNSIEDNMAYFPLIVGVPLVCVTAQRIVTEVSIARNDGQTIAQLAERAERFRCGNCGEQSAVAMNHLMSLRISPLDYMSLSNGDHTFVVIDRAANSIDRDPLTWGDTAVVCDPWIRQAYQARELLTRMRHISSDRTPLPYSRFRI